MKRLSLAIFSLLFLLAAVPAGAQKPKIVFDQDFSYYLDNREYGASNNFFTSSRTCNAARLTPSAGFELNDGKSIRHKVMLGVDIMKNMGESPTTEENAKIDDWDLIRELVLYYQLEKRSSKSLLTLNAGVFPRTFTKGRYTTSFISDSLRWFDNNIEGMVLSIEREKALYEVGLDWMGMYGSKRRERFMAFSFGEIKYNDWLSAGWQSYLYHYANTMEYTGVVDEALVEPFVRADFRKKADIQKLSLEAAWLQTFQRDRRLEDGFISPGGPEFTVEAGQWNVTFRNRLYWGAGLMPWYNMTDNGGVMYGSRLYRGDPFYKVHDDGSWKHWGTYDRLDVFWEPRISKYLTLRVGAVFHINDWKFSGWQQKLTLVFNI